LPKKITGGVPCVIEFGSFDLTVGRRFPVKNMDRYALQISFGPIEATISLGKFNVKRSFPKLVCKAYLKERI
jgi:hypothetical protein